MPERASRWDDNWPVSFDDLTEVDVQTHFRNAGTLVGQGNVVNILLRQAGVEIPVGRREYKTKPPVLILNLRSGSVGRENLSALHDSLVADKFELRQFFSVKRRLLQKVYVIVSLNDPMFPANCVAILRAVAAQLDSPWPQKISAGYGFHLNFWNLPGTRTFRYPLGWVIRRPSFIPGWIAGRTGYVIGWILGKVSGALSDRR